MPTPTLSNHSTLKHKRKLYPKYKVILHNDDVNDVLHVMQSLQDCVGLSEQRAHHVMYLAHTQGKALVISCVLEMAEFYKQQLQHRNLTVTLEQE